jgi:hypothetical protein
MLVLSLQPFRHRTDVSKQEKVTFLTFISKYSIKSMTCQMGKLNSNGIRLRSTEIPTL